MNESGLIHTLEMESERAFEDACRIQGVVDMELSGWKENTSAMHCIIKSHEPIKFKIRTINKRQSFNGNTSSIVSTSNSRSPSPFIYKAHIGNHSVGMIQSDVTVSHEISPKIRVKNPERKSKKIKKWMLSIRSLETD